MEKTDQRFAYRCLPLYYRGLDPGGAPAKISNHPRACGCAIFQNDGS
jgi:hypothetical protein